MNDLESQIAAWRARLTAALPGQDETINELEGHLRDHIEVQTKRGVSADEAFAQGVARLGEPRSLAREFRSIKLPWHAARPLWLIYGVVIATYLGFALLILGPWANPGGAKLLVIHALTISGGYLALMAAGLVGIWVLASPAGTPDLPPQRRELFRLSVIASVMIPVGTVLGMFWARDNLPGGAWSWQPVEVGALCATISAWLLLAVQLRPLSDAFRGAFALLAAMVVGIGWAAKATTSVVPIGWIAIAIVCAQIALLVVHHRSHRNRTTVQG